MKTALLIVDVQNDYFPDGKMELDGSAAACAHIKVVLERFRAKRLPVIYIRHISVGPRATFFLPDTAGAEIQESIKPEAGEKVITKHYPNSFRQTELGGYLKENGIDHLAIVGMMTHMCIDTTARAAYDLGYTSAVLGDCCATRSLSIGGVKIASRDVQNSFLAALNGTFAEVLNSDEYVRERLA